MNDKIDWSKAPEGATHAEMGALGHPIWYSIGQGKAYWWRQRSPSDASGEWASGPDISDIDEWETRPWLGEGVPPAGTRCEMWDGGLWGKVKVLFVSDLTVVVRFAQGDGFAEWARDVREAEFRPGPTPEQEQRQLAVDELCAIADAYGKRPGLAFRPFFEHLYDSGYRKVQP